MHPDDGRLWLAVDEQVFVIDAAMSPPTIDILSSPVGAIVDMAVDMTHRELVVLGDDGLAMIDFDDGTISADSQQATPAGLRGLATNASGDVHMVAEDCLYTRLAGDAAGWTKLAGCNGNTFPISSTGEVLTMEIIGQYVYVSMADEGVIRYDTASSTSSVWSSANVLHSDQVTSIVQMGSQILFGSEDAGSRASTPPSTSGKPRGRAPTGWPMTRSMVSRSSEVTCGSSQVRPSRSTTSTPVCSPPTPALRPQRWRIGR